MLHVRDITCVGVFSYVYCFCACEQVGTMPMGSNNGKSDVTILQHMYYAIVAS